MQTCSSAGDALPTNFQAHSNHCDWAQPESSSVGEAHISHCCAWIHDQVKACIAAATTVEVKMHLVGSAALSFHVRLPGESNSCHAQLPLPAGVIDTQQKSPGWTNRCFHKLGLAEHCSQWLPAFFSKVTLLIKGVVITLPDKM